MELIPPPCTQARLLWVLREMRVTIFVALLIAALLFLAGCQTPSSGFCSVAKPHRISASTLAVMTDAEVRQELTHNRTGASLCQWKP